MTGGHFEKFEKFLKNILFSMEFLYIILKIKFCITILTKNNIKLIN